MSTKKNQSVRKAAQVQATTPPALRYSPATAGSFKPGQKLRDPRPMAERFSRSLVRSSCLVKATKPAGQHETPIASEPSYAPRERSQLRAHGLRYIREGFGSSTAQSGEWRDATGKNGGAPILNRARVVARNLVAQWMFNVASASAQTGNPRIIDIGRQAGMTNPS